MLEKTKQWVGAITVDFDLGKHGEVDPVVETAELANCILVARVLIKELVAGKTQNLKPLTPQFVVQGLQAFELRCETTFTRGIHDQEHLAPVLCHALFITLDIPYRKIVDRLACHEALPSMFVFVVTPLFTTQTKKPWQCRLYGDHF